MSRVSLDDVDATVAQILTRIVERAATLVAVERVMGEVEKGEVLQRECWKRHGVRPVLSLGALRRAPSPPSLESCRWCDAPEAFRQQMENVAKLAQDTRRQEKEKALRKKEKGDRTKKGRGSKKRQSKHKGTSHPPT